MQIFVVNLDKDQDRMQHMQRQLDQFGLEFERISGVYGKEMSATEWRKHYNPGKAKWRQSRALSPAEVGCSLSHLKIYLEIIRRDLPMAFILEDDAVISEELEPLLGFFASYVDPKKSLAILFSDAVVDSTLNVDLPLEFSLASVQSADYTSSYIVSNEAAKVMLAELYPIGEVPDPWNRLMKYKRVDVQAVRPALIPQDQEAFGSSTTEGVKKVLGQHPFAIPMYKLRRARALLWDAIAPAFGRPKTEVPKTSEHPIDTLGS